MLALVGAWGRTENYRYCTVTSNHPDDCAFEGEVMTSLAPGSTVFHDITYRQRVRGYGTYLPLNLAARSLERLNVARAILICLKHTRPERLLAIQVDCLVFQPPRKVARRVCEELQDVTYSDLHLATRRPLTRYAGPIQDPIRSKEKVYQLKQLDEPLQVGGQLTRTDDTRPACAAPQWVTYTEPATGVDTFAEEVIRHVLEGRSALVQGPPGTGKSHLLAQLRDRLKEAGKTVEVLAPTNAAARIVGGCTVHNFLTRSARNERGFQGTLLIDEVSMLALALVAVLDNLRASGCHIVSFGDWDQLEPVGNSWRGKAVDPLILKDSALLKRWSDCTRFQLTRCRRSDPAHFAFYTQLHEDLSTAIAWTRAAYKRYTRGAPGALHLTISHRKRRSLNAELQEAFAEGKPGVTVPAHDGEPEYTCVPGTPLVGSCTNRGFVNGAFYEVIHSVDNLGWNLHVIDKLTGAILECSPDVLAKHTCLGHAVVYNRAQGLTIRDQTVVLHDMQSRYFRRPHLYVGLSRVTRGEDIRVAA